MAARNLHQPSIRPMAPILDGPTSTMRQVDVRDIHVGDYQRKLYPGRIRIMIRHWRPIDVGHVILSLRSDGRFFVIDGQHRIEAIRRLEGRVAQYVDAIVWESLSTTEESDMFRRPQAPENRKALTPEEIHDAALYSGDPQAMTIQQVVLDTGFRIGAAEEGEHRGRIKAVKHLYNVEERYGSVVLRDALELIGNAWGTTRPPESVLISGTALFLALFPGIKTGPLTNRMRKSPMTAWLRDASDRAKSLRFNQTEGVASLLHDDYNKVYRAHQLPEFASSLNNHKIAYRSEVMRNVKRGRS